LVLVLGVLVAGGLLAACGDGGGDGAPSFAEEREAMLETDEMGDEPPVGPARCDEFFAPGQPTIGAMESATCDPGDGVAIIPPTVVLPCDDGRQLIWNEYGWGYLDQPWTAHADGAGPEAPEADRVACDPDPNATTTAVPRLARDLPDAQGRNLWFIDDVRGEFWVDRGEGIVYLEAAGCDGRVAELQASPLPQLEGQTWEYRCFENPSPTTTTPGP
jgi:hypothetical protein